MMLVVINYTSDVNECTDNNGDCEHSCVNNEGSYSCSCQSGFSLNSNGRNCSGKNMFEYFIFYITFQISMSVILIMEVVNKSVLIQYHSLIVLVSQASE